MGLVIKHYDLMDRKGAILGTFKGRQPRQAAIKAACRGYIDIILREHGVRDKVHVFTGERFKTPVPTNAPEWLKGDLWKGKVKKIGVKYLSDVITCQQ